MCARSIPHCRQCRHTPRWTQRPGSGECVTSGVRRTRVEWANAYDACHPHGFHVGCCNLYNHIGGWPPDWSQRLGVWRWVMWECACSVRWLSGRKEMRLVSDLRVRLRRSALRVVCVCVVVCGRCEKLFATERVNFHHHRRHHHPLVYGNGLQCVSECAISSN